MSHGAGASTGRCLVRSPPPGGGLRRSATSNVTSAGGGGEQDEQVDLLGRSLRRRHCCENAQRRPQAEDSVLRRIKTDAAR